MKPTLARIFALLSLLLLVNGAAAADILKADNNTTLNLAGSWVGGVVPGASDFATWDSTVSAGKDESGWSVRVEVVEKKSLPDSQDILATYELSDRFKKTRD